MELVAVLASLAVVTLVLVGSLAGIAALILTLRLRGSLERAGSDRPAAHDDEIAARIAALERLAGSRLAPPAARDLPAAAPPLGELPERRVPAVPPRPSSPPTAAPPAPAVAEPPGADAPPASDSTPPLEAAQPGPIAIDWERWIGVRGAAAAGGVVLALAALLLFQYTIEHNLITPPMRVGVGIAAGLLCIALSEWLTHRAQPFAANALTGAGIVALYASFWADHSLYGLIGGVPAFALLVLTTVACGALSRRRASLLVAVLGLVGGFATPLLVTPGIDQPLTLFSYLLLLDGGLIWLSRQRGWPARANSTRR